MRTSLNSVQPPPPASAKARALDLRPDRSHGLITRMAALAMVAAASVVLSACSVGHDDNATASGKKVVSLVSDAPQTGAGAKGGQADRQSDAEDKRPQLRLDSSDEETDRFWDAYWACLQAHGYPMNTERVAGHGAQQAPPLQNVTGHEDAEKACQVKQPRVPIELDSERNPHYADDYRAYVKCLRDHHVMVHAVYDDGEIDGWTFDDVTQTMPEEQRTKIDKSCRQEAFGGK